MNIEKLMYGIGDDEFFYCNFDIELDYTHNNELTISSNSDIELILGESVVITVGLFSLDQISVRFVNNYGDYMNLVYAIEVFDMDKFVNWLKCSLRDFIWQIKQIANSYNL